ncbi:MAG: MFS transporter [Chloroflexota bacterium]|nr:MFS transporter [Chloroflexota bacterium]
MRDYWHRVRLFSRDVRLFLITAALIGFTVFGGIYTVLFNLYLVRLGYGPEFIGLVNAMNTVALTVFALPASTIGARFGVRRAMIVGFGLIMAGYSLTVLAEFVPVDSRQAWIVINYLIAGLGMALYFVNASPFVMAAARPEERNHVFSIQAALWPLAGFVGSLVGGLLPAFFANTLQVGLDTPAPFRYPMLMASGLLLIGIMALYQTKDATVTDQRRTVRTAYTNATPLTIVLVMGLVGVLRGSGEGAARTFFNLYMDTTLGVSALQIGAFLALGQLLSVPAALLTPFFAARWGNGFSMIGGTLGVALSLLPFALVPQWAVAGSSFMLMLVLVSVARPAYMVYSQEIVGPGWQGTMSAATTMAIGISWSVMAFGGGYLIALVGYRALFLSGALLTALGALLFWAYFRTPRGEFAQATGNR